MSGKARTLSEIRSEGFRAILDRLGPGDALRFMQQYDTGHGDYTAERHQWLDGLTVDDVLAGIEKRRAEKTGE